MAARGGSTQILFGYNLCIVIRQGNVHILFQFNTERLEANLYVKTCFEFRENRKCIKRSVTTISYSWSKNIEIELQ